MLERQLEFPFVKRTLSDEHCYLCTAPAAVTFEWYGLNQYGKRPLLVDQRGACDHPLHMLEVSYHDEFGGEPDELVKAGTEQKLPHLLVAVNDAYDILTQRRVGKLVAPLQLRLT